MELSEVCDKVVDHEGRIVELEKNDATTAVQLSGLTKVLWALVVAIFTSLLGFFFWFIQSLAR